MHQKTHPPLRVDLRPSRMGAGVAIVLHALAVIAALDAPGPWVAGVLLAVVLASAAVTMRRWRPGGGSEAIRAIERDGTGRWWVETGAGERLEAALGAPPVVSRPVVALSFRAGDRRWDVALLPDSAGPDQLRRLRAALRTGP